MCSSSTTLFNAALRAGLQMGARSNHKYYINRYPLGLDATVSIIGGSRQTHVVHQRHGPPHRHPRRSRSGSRAAGATFATRSGATPTGGRSRSAVPPSRTCARRPRTWSTVTTLRRGVREQVEYPVQRDGRPRDAGRPQRQGPRDPPRRVPDALRPVERPDRGWRLGRTRHWSVRLRPAAPVTCRRRPRGARRSGWSERRRDRPACPRR